MHPRVACINALLASCNLWHVQDATFHTAEWHAARIASLTAERPAWEDWRAQQKEEERKLRQTEEEEERRQRKLHSFEKAVAWLPWLNSA